MNIYFACSITGGRKDELNYQKIVQTLLEAGHHVPTAELANTEVINLEKVIDPFDVYHRDTNWIQECDVLIAEISTPSHGVGYEIGYALSLGKPVICLHKTNTTISKMILGNQDKNLSIFSYQSIGEVWQYLQKRLDEIFYEQKYS